MTSTPFPVQTDGPSGCAQKLTSQSGYILLYFLLPQAEQKLSEQACLRLADTLTKCVSLPLVRIAPLGAADNTAWAEHLPGASLVVTAGLELARQACAAGKRTIFFGEWPEKYGCSPSCLQIIPLNARAVPCFSQYDLEYALAGWFDGVTPGPVGSPAQLNALKLAGLRAGALVQAGARRSRMIRWASAVHTWRKQVKQICIRALRHGMSRPHSGDKLRVLVHIKGGIGDVAMTRVFVKKLREVLPEAEILFCHDSRAIVRAVFPDGWINGYQDVNYLAADFDLVIAGCHFLMYTHYKLDRLCSLAPHFLPYLAKGLEVQQYFTAFETYTPDLDGMLAEIALAHGGSRITNLGWFSGLDVKQNDRAPWMLDPGQTKTVLEKWGLAGRCYITIHDGINAYTDTSSGHPTRCWPKAHWEEFVKLFKAGFPEVAVVQLGGRKSEVFSFADVSLVGKTTVEELPYLLAQAQLHVDGESGMVHLANHTATPSVVLFGPSKAGYLAYARNTNLSAQTCGGCMNISRHWMTRCVLGRPPARQCLASITAPETYRAVQQRLQDNTNGK